jgi:serine/threonine protein kinase
MTEKTYRNALDAGREILWYRIDRVLGQGAFGITYLARDVNLDRRVAIKEYLPSGLAMRSGDLSVHTLSDDQGDDFRRGLDRFLKEARTLALFEHPNVVRVLNVLEANGTAYMVMNYEEGETLRDLLARRGTLPESDLRRLLLPLLDGLDHVHAAGFIHRDIKPANLFIRTDGTPLLIDFGAARQALLTGQMQTMTSFVSKGYAAIEQYSSKGDRQGPWTDIYGMGATLFRAITGMLPADAIDRSEALSHGTSDILSRLADIAAGRYSTGFLRAIDHAIAFRAQDRPQSIAEWRREIEAAVPEATPGDTEVPTQVMPHAEPGVAAAQPPSEASTVIAPVVAAMRSGNRRTARVPILAISSILVTVVLVSALYTLSGDKTAAPAEMPALPSAPPPGPDAAPEIPAGPATTLDTVPAADAPQTTVAAAVEAVSTPAPTSAEEITALLAQARDDIAALRLTTPKGESAFDRYMSVLVLDPKNSAAQNGVAAIADKYVELAYRDIAAGKLERAQGYLDKAAELAPDSPSLRDAKVALAERRKPVVEAAGTESPPPDNATDSLKDKAGALKKRFDDFLKSQYAIPREETRADELRDRLGGSR